MNQIVRILPGIGLLIAIFLFLNHGTKTVEIIEALASNSIQGIKTLQGR